MLMCMGSGLCCGWLQCTMYLLYWAWQIWSVLPVCRNCGVHEQCWVCMVCIVYGLYAMLEFKLCCEILLLLNMVGMDQWMTVEWAMLSTLFIWIGYVHVEFYRVCIFGNLNGTRYRDGVKVYWCHSHLVWLFFFRFPSLHAFVSFECYDHNK